MFGEVAATIAALVFSSASVLYRYAMRGQKLSPIIASGVRAGPVLLILALAYPFLGTGLDKPFLFYVSVFLSSFSAFILGDSLFLYGLSKASLGIVYPVAYTFSLFSTLFAWLFLSEKITLSLLVAAFLIISGIYMVYSGGKISSEKNLLVGLLSGLGASFFWGLSILFTAIALRWGNPIDVNMVRVFFLFVMTAPLVARARQSLAEVKLKHLVIGGVFGIGLGPLIFFSSILLIGASKSSIIISSTPILTVLLAKFVLKEKTTGKIFLGALAVTAGLVILVTSPF